MSKKGIRKMNRSGTQTCPICGRRGPLVEHHVEGRQNNPCHVAWICASCHNDAHVDPPRIIIEGVFMTTSGKELIWRRADERPKVSEGVVPPIY